MIGRVASVTDPGRRRRRNEDAYVCEPPLFAIADGMGGAQAGEVASRLAAAALKEGGAENGGGAQRIVDLIQEANRRIYDRSSTDPKTSGMGTTMTVALVEDAHVTFGHVGDSRAYLVRDGEIEQLTGDHSLVNELIKSGQLSPDDAGSHPQRSVITRALGTDPDVDVDTFSVAAQTNDLFLLSSDGLTDMLGDSEILDVVERNRKDLDSAMRALVKEANRGGGEDNITVVAFEISDAMPAQDGQTQEQALPPELVEQQAAADDEDTLDETDGVPVVDTMVISAERIREHTEAEQQAPRRNRRRRTWSWLAIVLFVLAVAAIVAWRLLR